MTSISLLKIKLECCHLYNGFYYSNQGDKVFIGYEPYNKHDNNAIVCKTKRFVTIGYFPRDAAEDLSKIGNREYPFQMEGFIAEIGEARSGYRYVKVICKFELEKPLDYSLFTEGVRVVAMIGSRNEKVKCVSDNQYLQHFETSSRRFFGPTKSSPEVIDLSLSDDEVESTSSDNRESVHQKPLRDFTNTKKLATLSNTMKLATLSNTTKLATLSNTTKLATLSNTMKLATPSPDPHDDVIVVSHCYESANVIEKNDVKVDEEQFHQWMNMTKCSDPAMKVKAEETTVTVEKDSSNEDGVTIDETLGSNVKEEQHNDAETKKRPAPVVRKRFVHGAIRTKKKKKKGKMTFQKLENSPYYIAE